MKKHVHAATPARIEQLQLNYPHVYQLLKQGDDTMGDILADMDSAGLKEDDLPIMEAALKLYPEYRLKFPNPQNDAILARRITPANGLGLIHKFFHFWREGIK